MSKSILNFDDSFQEGLKFFESNQKVIRQQFIHSFLTWCDSDFYQNEILLAHIVINESDCQCEIISLLTSYSVTCAGYNILIRLPGEQWKLHNCVGTLKDVNCEECGYELNTHFGTCYTSCEMLDKKSVSEEEYENHNTYDLCYLCAKKNPELITKKKMFPLTTDTYHYFGFNTYSLSNFKKYAKWNWTLESMGALKTPLVISDTEYQKLKEIQEFYWESKIAQRENEITRSFDSFLSKLVFTDL